MNAAEKKKQFFTLSEATSRLPLVRAIVEDIVRQARDVHDRQERLKAIREISGVSARRQENAYSEEVDEIESELERDGKQLQAYADELADLGVELKDPFNGLVDFPTLVEDREAYLCWKLGEDEIGFWHETNAGFQGRQSLFEDSVPGDPPAKDENSK